MASIRDSKEAPIEADNAILMGVSLKESSLADQVHSACPALSYCSPPTGEDIAISGSLLSIVKVLVSRGEFQSFLASLGTTPKASTPSSPAMAGQTTK